MTATRVKGIAGSGVFGWPLLASGQQLASPVIGFLDLERPKWSGPAAWISTRPERDQLRRRRERSNRIQMG